jgi:hypothetical protein
MATLWSCPKSDCPPSEIAPVDVPDSGEAAGAGSERPFTADEVAALLNVPLDTIFEWHKQGTGPPGYQSRKSRSRMVCRCLLGRSLISSTARGSSGRRIQAISPGVIPTLQQDPPQLADTRSRPLRR